MKQCFNKNLNNFGITYSNWSEIVREPCQYILLEQGPTIIVNYWEEKIWDNVLFTKQQFYVFLDN